MRYIQFIPAFIRQAIFKAIAAELAKFIPTDFPQVEALEEKLVAVIQRALGV